MSFDAVPANQFPLYINTTPEAAATWVQVRGINSLTPQPSTQTADSSTFDNPGWVRESVVGRGLSYAVAGLRQEDEDGVQDPGQVAIQTLGALTGKDCVGEFKVELPDGTADSFSASVRDVVAYGGAGTANATWSCVLALTGPATNA